MKSKIEIRRLSNISLGLALMFLLMACPPCGDSFDYDVMTSDMTVSNMDNTGYITNYSDNPIPAKAYAISVEFESKYVGNQYDNLYQWSIIPNAQATSCVENYNYLDSIKTISIRSTSDFSDDLLAGSELSDLFTTFDTGANNDSYNRQQQELYYLLVEPSVEQEYQFIIEVETMLGELYIDTTATVLLTL